MAILATMLAATAAAQTRSSMPEAQNRSVVTPTGPETAARGNKSAAQVDFLVEALRTSLAEVRIGELAAQKGSNARIKDYGMKLKNDHMAHAKELERMIEPLGVTVPTEPSSEALAHHDSLTRLSGTEFDAAFVQMMIWSHTEAIEKYGAQTHANPDKALHDFASQSLPMLREHLAAAEALR
jgi:putative membrane protein